MEAYVSFIIDYSLNPFSVAGVIDCANMHKSSTVTPFDLDGTEPSLVSLLPFLRGSKKLNITLSIPH